MMPEFTPNSNIPYPAGGDPIRGSTNDNLRTDIRDLAFAADAADVAARVRAVSETKAALEPRVQFAEKLAAEPGTWLVNTVLDPIPVDAPSNYTGGRVTFQQAPGTPYGWGRANCSAVGATSVIPKTGGVGERAIAATAGQPVAAHVQLRAMPDQAISATLFIDGFTPDGDTLGSSSTLLSSGQLDIPEGQTVTFKIAGVLPASPAFTHIALRWSFRRFGQTYPEVGDYVLFRRAMLTVGDGEGRPPAPDYFDGNSPNSYWTGAEDMSQSVTAQPRGSAGGGGTLQANAALAHAVLLDDWSHRMGGAWRLPGGCTISFRIDHGLAKFNEILRPLLEAAGFPYTIALGADTWGQSENSGVTKEMVNSWVEGGLCSIASHGWGNHVDTSDHATIEHYVVDSKVRLEADIPAAAPIDIYMPHGGSGSGNYDGFKPTDSPAKYYGTFAGQTALATYPICTGQFPGTAYRVQDGRPRVGQAYFNMDTFTASQVLSRVNTAVSTGRGIQLMIHPSLINNSEHITTAELATLIGQLKTMHDAGTVKVVSVAAQYLCDSTT